MSERILVVEDEDEVRLFLQTALTGGGYQVDVAATAEEAQRRLRQTPYRLVIADWWLSDGNGLAIVDEAASLGAKTAVLSGYISELLGDKARHTLLRKPISPSELVSAVERLVVSPAG